MTSLLRRALPIYHLGDACIHTHPAFYVPLTAQEIAAALRPFYFAVHPDLFWQHPKEKAVNENSLKHLNAYLETVLQNKPLKPTSLTFFVRDTKAQSPSVGMDQLKEASQFRTVSIKLVNKDIHSSLHKILSACQLPTEYIDEIAAKKSSTNGSQARYDSTIRSGQTRVDFNQFWRNMAKMEQFEEKLRNKPDQDLRSWLDEYVESAKEKQQACQPIREEIAKLSTDLKEYYGLKDIIWDCGWGTTPYRGCLETFRKMAEQHPQDMRVLKGRTLVFGRRTGVSLDGHIILSSDDVRHNWLNLIRSAHEYDYLFQQLPQAEHCLSEVLRGIHVDHRKFQPAIMIQQYIQQLNKLTAALYKHRWQHSFPPSWPRRLDNFKLVVECEAGPLMLSPTGQFIVPASCPAFLLVDFISTNMQEAKTCLDEYKLNKIREKDICERCIEEIGLESLQKDDNVTPDLMLKCCERLLYNATLLSRYLRNCRLRISTYYSVLQDGEMCIPWNWKERAN